MTTLYSFIDNASYYETSGFLTIQQAVEQVLLEHELNTTANVKFINLNPILINTELLPSDKTSSIVIIVVTPL